MSALPPPPPVDDELASAYLDGEATPAERRRVAGDSVLLARVAELARIRALVAEPVRVDAAQRERTIATALGVLDGNVARLGRRPRHRQWMALAAVAAVAAVALVLGVVGLVATGDDDTDVAAPSTTPTPASPLPTGGPSQNPDFPRTSEVEGPSALGRAVALGDFGDVAALAAAVGGRAEAGARATGTYVRDACGPDGAQASFTATVQGRAVKVFLAADASGRLTQATVVAADDCSPIDAFTLP